MREYKVLLQLLVDTIKDYNPIDGVTLEGHSNGLCEVIRRMHTDELISEDEMHSLLDDIHDEILNTKYSNYPVIYYDCPYGRQSSQYFFPRKNWSIRIAWLEDVIKNS